MSRSRCLLDRKVDRGVALMLGLLVLARYHDPTLIDGYLLTLQTRAIEGATMGSC